MRNFRPFQIVKHLAGGILPARVGKMHYLAGQSVDITSAVLYSNGQKILDKQFPAISMQDGDSLQLTWTLDCSGGKLLPRRAVPKQVDLNVHSEGVDELRLTANDRGHGPEDPDFASAVKSWTERL